MKRIISLILTAVILISAASFASAENALPFADIKSTAWYYGAVAEVYAAGIMEGKGEGKFAPKASMTRAELVTVLCRLSGDNSAGKGTALTFTDTKKNAWYADSVAWAVEAGIVAGYEGNTFKPNRPILRQELAKMFVAFLEYMALPLDGTPLADSFKDSSAFPKWASQYIETLRKTGLMGGDNEGNFKPRTEASRAEIATVITRLLAHMGNSSDRTIITDKKFDYSVVYDVNDEFFKQYGSDLGYRLKVEQKFRVDIYSSTNIKDDGKPHIIFGNVGESAAAVYNSLDPKGDFAVAFSGKDLIVCANDKSLYPYLIKVFEAEVMGAITEGDLTLPRDFSRVYSRSELKGMPFSEYSLRYNAVTGTEIYDIMKLAEPFTDSNGTTIQYRIFVPYDYDPNKAYPLLLSMHGAGESFIKEEEDLSSSMRVLCNLFNIKNTPVTDAIIISPQCPQETGDKWVDTNWSDGNYSTTKRKETKWLKAVVELIAHIESEYSIDTDRRYIGGLSMGGFATWDLIVRHTELFAAAVPICGGADPAMAEKLRDFPIYTSHGDADNVVPVDGTREMVEALRAAGNTKVIYDELPGAGHVIWHTVTQNPDVINWLFEQRLSDRK